MAADLPELLLPDAATWRAWLEDNGETSPGVRLVLSKKGGSVTALDYDTALDAALCFGWIDGVIGRRDEGSYLTRFTPRRPRSKWSQTNVRRVERLAGEGKLAPAGVAAINSAKADGRWEAAYAGAATAEVPADLAAKIAANPAAQAMFNLLTSTNRYALIYRTNSVASAAVRATKIAGFVEQLARGETIYPQRKFPPQRRPAMPAREELPSTLQRSPKHAQEIWSEAHDSAVGTYGEGERAHRTAFAALKHKFEKVGDHWEEKAKAGPSDKKAEGGAGSPGTTAGGVDANASKKHLLDVAKRLDVSGRWSMTKAQLVQAIGKANDKKTRDAR